MIMKAHWFNFLVTKRCTQITFNIQSYWEVSACCWVALGMPGTCQDNRALKKLLASVTTIKWSNTRYFYLFSLDIKPRYPPIFHTVVKWAVFSHACKHWNEKAKAYETSDLKCFDIERNPLRIPGLAGVI